MSSSRERVLKALNFETPDRLPKDLGGMRSTGVSAFAYPRLVAALGLPPRTPRVEDTVQMLALPDLDVLDALGCDVVTVSDGVTNAFHQPRKWHSYDFNGRLPARVLRPARFKVQDEGVIHQGKYRMPPSSYVFDELHAGQPLNLTDELPKVNLRELERKLQREELRDKEIVALRELCRRARESSDRAVFFGDAAVHTPICIHEYGGLADLPDPLPDRAGLRPRVARDRGTAHPAQSARPAARNPGLRRRDHDDRGRLGHAAQPDRVAQDISARCSCPIAGGSTTKYTGSHPASRPFCTPAARSTI